ncbi:MAG: LysR family transcriptional regulator [Clostridia bacterium]|nr:LysR family transcriptional regulator [Clostridia bacterium]
MELLQLKYFCDAAQTESFSATARKYSVPASNISQSVHRLEKGLGVSLFTRTANRIRLSDDGEIFLRGVKTALLSLENAKKAVQSRGEIRGEIRICILTNRRIVTKVIGEFKKQYPDVTFKIKHFKAHEADSFDVIIGDGQVYPAGFSATKLIEEKLMLAVHKDYIGQAQSLPSLRFITMQKTASQYFYTTETCKKLGFVPNIAIETDDPSYVRAYIEMGLGAAIVPVFSWEGLFSEQIYFKDIGDFSRTTFLYVNQNRYATPAIQLFHRAIVKACKNTQNG